MKLTQDSTKEYDEVYVFKAIHDDFSHFNSMKHDWNLNRILETHNDNKQFGLNFEALN